jgi:hypothetical protein
MAIDPNDYYVITSRRGEHPDRWSWEIRRKSKPLGIKMTGDGYQSDTARNLPTKRWWVFCPSYRKKKNAHVNKAASVGGPLSFPFTFSPSSTERRIARKRRAVRWPSRVRNRCL